jgi:hypothetical protein
MTTHAKGKKSKKEPEKIEEATITAVTDTSITISNQKVQSRVKNDATDTATTVSKTYQISALTDIEVDGASANVSALHAGMFVEISADPPSDLGPADETNGGLARTINAHENNGTPPPK